VKPCITVLTPLYNRAEFIDTLYRSLASQTRKDFQWLIIDDGSTESSEEKLRAFAESSEFPIDYYYKENGGKHTALNFSHPYIRSDWVLILDSDDTLTEDAVAVAAEYIEKYSDNKDIGVISFQRGTDKASPLVEFDAVETVSDYIEYRINQNRPGDCCEVVRSSVLKEFPFPVFPGERYLSEVPLWVGSADKYKTAFIPRVIYICEYRDEGLTLAGRSMWRKCPQGCFHNQILGLNKRCSFKYRVKRALLVHYYGRVMKMKNKDICKRSGYPAFVRAFTLPGMLLYHYWERKYK